MSEPTAFSTEVRTPAMPAPVLPFTPGIRIIAGVSFASYLLISFGICAASCSDLLVSESNIYDCSYLGAQLDNVEDALFTGCSVTDCGSDYGFNGFFLNNCSGVFFDRDLLSDGEYRIGAAG